MKIGPYRQFSIRNRVSLFSRLLEVTRGHERSKIENFQDRSNDLSNRRKLHDKSNETIFSTVRGHPRSPGVTEGQTWKIFMIGQMTYQTDGNCTGNRMQPLLGPPKITRGQRRSHIRTKLARRATTRGTN